MVCDRPGFNEAAAYHCGKRRNPSRWRATIWCFNEAAAYHCGKPGFALEHQRRRPASMRPQHITAENRVTDFVTAFQPTASMRPQHITAENVSSKISARLDAALQ